MSGEAEPEAGVLYVVATPIGNLADLSQRAVQILGSVHRIYAEDTRHSARLCEHLGSRVPLISLHEHNEDARVAEVLAWLDEGRALALISDAGTPLVSDPGFRLIAACHRHGARVSPVPGASALTAALSVCGLPIDQFRFVGFPPSRRGKRLEFLQALRADTATLVLFESTHRIRESLADMETVFGAQRQGCIARELTKLHESVYRGSLAELQRRLAADRDATRGEFVVVLAGAERAESGLDAASMQLLQRLAELMPPRKAARIVAEHAGVGARECYDWLLRSRDG